MIKNGKKRILLIENNQHIALLIEKEFRSGNHPIISLKHEYSLGKGLDAYKQDNYDAVFLSLYLPEFKNLESTITSVKTMVDTAIVLILDEKDEYIGNLALEKGFHSFINRNNINHENLFNTIQYALNRKKLEQNLRTNANLLFSIFNELPSILFLINKERQIIKINKAGAKFSKKSEMDSIGDLPGDALHCLNALGDEKGCGHSENCNTCILNLTTRQSFKLKKSHTNINGILPVKKGKKVHYLNINFSTSFIENNSEPYVLVSINDTTRLRNYQKKVDKSNKRLESLIKISQYKLVSEQDFLNFSLDLAMDLCESKYGYIYHYIEEKEKFVLNSWSKDVMEACKVTEPQTEYALHDTGCWGDVVRLRKPVIINDYSPKHKSAKGLPKGHVQLFRFLSVPIFREEKIVAVIGVANKDTDYDETDQKQLSLLMDGVWSKLEQERNRLKLIRAKEHAEESDRLKSTFLATMSHELRTPLNSVIGFSELILEEESSIIINEFARNINKSGNHLLTIIEEIFSISELESTGSKLNKELVKISDLFLSIEDEVRKFDSSNKPDLSIQVKGLKNIDKLFINTDKQKIIQVFVHLINNAIKFSSKGEVNYGICIENNTPAMYVSDKGIGIKEEHKEIIFERFAQIEQSITRQYDGIGLGLSICKRIVDLFNGKIWIESAPGRGTSVFFTFPEFITNILRPIDVEDPFLKLE